MMRTNIVDQLTVMLEAAKSGKMTHLAYHCDIGDSDKWGFLDVSDHGQLLIPARLSALAIAQSDKEDRRNTMKHTPKTFAEYAAIESAAMRKRDAICGNLMRGKQNFKDETASRKVIRMDAVRAALSGREPTPASAVAVALGKAAATAHVWLREALEAGIVQRTLAESVNGGNMHLYSLVKETT